MSKEEQQSAGRPGALAVPDYESIQQHSSSSYAEGCVEPPPMNLLSSPEFRRSLSWSKGVIDSPRAKDSALRTKSRKKGSRPSFLEGDEETQPLVASPTSPNLHIEVIVKGKKNSYFEAVFNTTNVLVGVGLLSYPYALKCTGWSGLALLLFICASTNYTAKVIVRCMKATRASGFPDIGRVTYGPVMEKFILVVFFVELFLACASLVILSGDNLHKLFPHFLQRDEWMMFSFGIMLLTSYVKNFAILSYFSIFGILSSAFLILVIMINGFAQKQAPGSIIDPQETTIIDYSNFPLALGLFMSGFAGHAVFPNVYESMEDKRQYSSVVNVSYILTALMYSSIAVLGYLMYGNAVHPEVTLNFGDGFLSLIANWITVLNPLTKFALALYPLSVSIEVIVQVCKQSEDEVSHTVKVIIRTIIGLFILLTAIFLPHFDTVLGLLGSFCSYTVSLTFPCLCLLKLERDTLSWSERLVNIGLVGIGIFLALFGTVMAITGPLW